MQNCPDITSDLVFVDFSPMHKEICTTAMKSSREEEVCMKQSYCESSGMDLKMKKARVKGMKGDVYEQKLDIMGQHMKAYIRVCGKNGKSN